MPRVPDGPPKRTSNPMSSPALAPVSGPRTSNPARKAPSAPSPAEQAQYSPPERNYWMEGGSWGPLPVMSSDLTFKQVGSSGLRAYGGWVREEFLPQLVGRQAARVYREMVDNDATVGAIMFAITQTMRQVDWHVEGPDDSPKSKEMEEFVQGVMDDMSESWSEFITEALTMLPYGYAPHEINYKRRLGRKPGKDEDGNDRPRSKFDDGKIGIRNIPLRGQDTVLKWFFDNNGEFAGMTQQPWIGPMIDIPAEKMLLFRPRVYKNNPEGYSVLRQAYRPYYFIKRLQEQEAVMFERFSGFPIITVPSALLEAASQGDANASSALAEYKRIVTNARIDEQMGGIFPSDTYKDANGSPTSVPMYEFKLVAPQQSKAAISANTSIERYKLEIMTCVLADFLQLGHSSRGTQNIAMTKVDLFFQAIEGWMSSISDVLNNYLLPRLWDLNGFDFEHMPRFRPDMPQRTDLDALSNFVMRLGQTGFITPDADTQQYLRDIAGLPDISQVQQADVLIQPERDEPWVQDSTLNTQIDQTPPAMQPAQAPMPASMGAPRATNSAGGPPQAQFTKDVIMSSVYRRLAEMGKVPPLIENPPLKRR